MEDESETRQREDEEEAGGGFDIRLVKSYLGFAVRAWKARKLQVFGVLLVGLVLTGLVVTFIPRTYKVTTVLMTMSNFVLDGRDAPEPLGGATGLVTRRENLDRLIRQTRLLDTYSQRRPPILLLKDRVMSTVGSPMSEKARIASLVGTLETRLEAVVEEDRLSISVEWTDPDTPTELARAAQDEFLKVRHAAEISAFQEKMAIVDSHANKLLQEVSGLAAQLTAEAAEAAAKRPAAVAVPGKAAAVPLAAARPSAPALDEQLPALKEKLALANQKLAAVEAERSTRISAERTKLDELKLKLTPSHPDVIAQQDRVRIASDVRSDVMLLRSEVADLEGQIKQRDAMARTGQAMPGAAPRAAAVAASADTAPLLPPGVSRLLSSEEGDPAIKAQLSGAVIRYATLRDQVRAAKMDLDTAQAAYNHRYRVVIPVERPDGAKKPNVAALAGGGFFLSLLLALLLPLISELRRGVLVEYWQVRDFQLPVLAELRLPPGPEQR